MFSKVQGRPGARLLGRVAEISPVQGTRASHNAPLSSEASSFRAEKLRLCFFDSLASHPGYNSRWWNKEFCKGECLGRLKWICATFLWSWGNIMLILETTS